MPDRKLARKITLADGTELRTVAEAATLIEERFRSTITWGVLEHALVLLARAADTGKRADIAAATDQLDLVLRHSRMM